MGRVAVEGLARGGRERCTQREGTNPKVSIPVVLFPSPHLSWPLYFSQIIILLIIELAFHSLSGPQHALTSR